MPAVSDTSPISNLAIIGRLKLLREQFGEVWIPRAVAEELRNMRVPEARSAIDQAMQEGWLKAKAVNDRRLIALLRNELHVGEAEAIALAVESGAELILLDEREARSAAGLLDLQVTGVLGILLRAKRDGAIQTLRQEIEALRRKANFFVSDGLEAQIVREAGE